jgi:hypothetical protein
VVGGDDFWPFVKKKMTADLGALPDLAWRE